MIWAVLIACFAATAFVGILTAVVRGLGYQVGPEEDS
jgi:hypothetical protein